MKITTDPVLPCLAAHKMTFSIIPHREDLKPSPLTLCFPYPVMSDEIHVKEEDFGKSLVVSMKKALCEPWPSDFQEQLKWKVEEMPPFPLIDPNDNSCAISRHTNEGQYDREAFRKFQDAKNKKKEPSLSPIEDARRITLMFFPLMLKSGYDYITVLDADNDTALWHILVRRPIVTSPLGVPMLSIIAFDLDMLRKHSANGNLDGKRIERDYQRIFGVHKKLSLRLPMFTEEGAELFRLSLRVNSIKIQPTKWQKENLPSVDYSPFLATFLAPLYLDNQHSWDVNEFELRKVGLHVALMPPNYLTCGSVGGRCTGCGMACSSLTPCTNCNFAYYCSVSCQKRDWKTHQHTCIPIDY